jgi:hypothetical protein
MFMIKVLFLNTATVLWVAMIWEAVTCRQDSGSASYGTTYYASDKYTDRWIMYYLGTSNVSDPINKIPSLPFLTLEAESNRPGGPWVKNYDKSPFSPAANTYYSASASPGMIIKQNGEHFMFFSSSTIVGGKIERTIGLARSLDLIRWQIDSSPILPIEEQIENASLYYQPSNTTWYLFTNHVGIDENGVEYTDSIWVYWSKYLLFWNPIHKAVVIDRSNTTEHYKCIGLPSVITTGRELYVYYDSPGRDSISHMGRDVGLAVVDLPITLGASNGEFFDEDGGHVSAVQSHYTPTHDTEDLHGYPFDSRHSRPGISQRHRNSR